MVSSFDWIGTQALKNLILPGIGWVTVVDSQTVTMRDLGTNFFVTHDSVGQPWHEVTLKNLLELNPDVQGSSTNDDPFALLASDNRLEYFKQFTLIIACELSNNDALKLDEICKELSIPYQILRSYGQIGYLR